jgi:hypothetical protein
VFKLLLQRLLRDDHGKFCITGGIFQPNVSKGPVQQFRGIFICFVTFQIALSLLVEALVRETSQVKLLNASIDAGTFHFQDSNTLSKRELDYAEAIRKGNGYWCILENPVVTGGQSTFTQEKDLADSGWTRAEQDVKSIILSNLQPAFNKEHINVLRPDCTCASWEHTKAKKNSKGILIPVCLCKAASRSTHANNY